MLVGSAPHHATSPPTRSKMSMSLLVFDVGGLRTSPPTSIENEHVVAHFQCWWAPHLTTTSPPPTTTENEYVCTRFRCWSAIYLTTTSLPPTTTTANEYPCTHFQWCSATYITTTCSHHRKRALVLIFEGV